VNAIKESRGTRQEARVPNWQTIRSAVANDKRADALYSFAIALLPFVVPDKATRALESMTFSPMAPNIYAEGMESYKVFWALAFYCVEMGFKFRERLDEKLRKLARKFESFDGVLTPATDTGVGAIQTAIERWRPTTGTQTVTSERARKMAQDVVNMLFVEYARESDPSFKAQSST
jgi:hypothetical protein